jgi:hypothetical protein
MLTRHLSKIDAELDAAAVQDQRSQCRDARKIAGVKAGNFDRLGRQ